MSYLQEIVGDTFYWRAL